MSARKHEFAYDGIGNRRTSNTSGVAALRDHYVANELNQYVARENNTLPVGGTVADDAAIKVVAGSGALVAAGRHGRHWGDNMLLENLAGPYLGPVSFFAGKAGGGSASDVLKTVSRTAFLPPAWQSFVYDEDGNLLADGVWSYVWDAENRLISMQTLPAAIGAGMIAAADARRLEFRYDHLGRRVQKVVRAGWNGSTFASVITQKRFIYHGWNLVAEFTVNSGLELARTYTWGLDIVHSLAESGGVGALLQISDHSSGKSYLPSYDGKGNVAALFDAGAASSATACVAAYEYSPFGEFIRSEGAYAKENAFRFSTKFTDDETGLVYYGRRYYSPSQGRFLGRDPIEEQGGLNLYGFVGNNPVSLWDILGMAFVNYDHSLHSHLVDRQYEPGEVVWIDDDLLTWDPSQPGDRQSPNPGLNLDFASYGVLGRDAPARLNGAGKGVLPQPTQEEIEEVWKVWGQWIKIDVSGSALPPDAPGREQVNANIEEIKKLVAQAVLYRRPDGSEPIAMKTAKAVFERAANSGKTVYIGEVPSQGGADETGRRRPARGGKWGDSNITLKRQSNEEMVVSLMHELLHAADIMGANSFMLEQERQSPARHDEIYRMANQTRYELVGMVDTVYGSNRQITDAYRWVWR